jgi:multicomponent Na+:H+ antiporter subunit D
VAIVQSRHGTAELTELHGRAHEQRSIGAAFALGGLMIASLPLTGSFLGRSLVEDAALAQPGYRWLPAVMLVVSGVLAGTMLSAAGRMFWGLGVRAPRSLGGEPEDEGPQREEQEGRHRSARLRLTVVGLLAAAVAWGLVPGLADAAGRAAAAFVDQRGYAAAVLDGNAHAPPAEALAAPGATAYLYAAGSLAVALATAAALLARPFGSSAAVMRLRRLHNGRPGDYVAWTALGAAVLAGLLVAVAQ